MKSNIRCIGLRMLLKEISSTKNYEKLNRIVEIEINMLKRKTRDNNSKDIKDNRIIEIPMLTKVIKITRVLIKTNILEV